MSHLCKKATFPPASSCGYGSSTVPALNEILHAPAEDGSKAVSEVDTIRTVTTESRRSRKANNLNLKRTQRRNYLSKSRLLIGISIPQFV